MMLPRPPSSEAPPTTATTIAVRERSDPWVGVAEPKEPNWMIPVNAARTDESTKHAALTALTGTPIARAARPSPPLAKIQLPTAVVLSTSDSRIATPTSQRTETEIWVLPNSACPSHCMTADLPKKEMG